MRPEVFGLLSLSVLFACAPLPKPEAPTITPLSPPTPTAELFTPTPTTIPPTDIPLQTNLVPPPIDEIPRPQERRIPNQRSFNVFVYGSSTSRMFIEQVKTDTDLIAKFGNSTVTGRGNDGWDIDAMDRNLDEELKHFRFDQTKENVIVIQPGAIDLILGQDPRYVIQKAERFLDRVEKKLPGVTIILDAPRPVLDPNIPPTRQADFAILLQELAVRRHWGFMNTGPLFMKGALPNTELYVFQKNKSDVLHPNENGLKIIGYALYDTLYRLPRP